MLETALRAGLPVGRGAQRRLGVWAGPGTGRRLGCCPPRPSFAPQARNAGSYAEAAGLLRAGDGLGCWSPMRDLSPPWALSRGEAVRGPY